MFNFLGRCYLIFWMMLVCYIDVNTVSKLFKGIALRIV